MEILGNIIPRLENAIASGLDSVRTGIMESAKAIGPDALGIAQESFSFEQMGPAVSTDLPAVAPEGDYVSLQQYFQSGLQFDSPVSAADIMKSLNAPAFNTTQSLQMLNHDLQGLIDQGLQALKRIQPDASSILEYGDPLRQTEADASPLLNFLGMKQEMDAYIENQREQSKAGLLLDKIAVTLEEARKHGSSIEVNDVVAGDTDAGSDRGIIVVGGKTDVGSDRGIIVVGGKTDVGSDRGIIVVGGKTPDTFFQTIDDSWNQFQASPTPQNADAFGTQLSAVRGMTSTVNQVVQMQQSLGASLLSRQFGM